MDSAKNDANIPQKLLILIALLQGFTLLILHQSIELDFWLHDQPQWIFSLYCVALSIPTILLLSLSDKANPVYKWIICYAIVVFIIGYYIGSQAIPFSYLRYQTLLFTLVITMCIAAFKFLMYVQHFAAGGPLSYSRLFLLSWRNFLTLGLSLLFTLLTWGILMLWAGLFKAIRIDFFYDLFTERWFFYPVLALANGFGVIIFRQQSNVIDTITRIQQTLLKFLLVILVFVSMIFLGTLPFTGLEPLWETGGSTLILWMQALMLFFVNSVYQDDPESQTYKLWVHRFIYFGLALLPIYSLISFYGLTLRVEQYGWSVSRCWALMLWAIFAAFSLGYLWGIIRYKDRWLHQLSWVNVRLGLVVLTLMLIVNSPILDFRKIAVDSQMERLKAGAVSLTDFDYAYMRNHLAGPGYEALQSLKHDLKESNPEIVFKINSLYRDYKENGKKQGKEDFLLALKGLTPAVPKSLTDKMYKNLINNNWRINRNISYHLLPVDLNSDGVSDYIFVEERSGNIVLTMYYQLSGEWASKGLNSLNIKVGTGQERKEAIMKALQSDDYMEIEPTWQDFIIGGYKFKVP
jgi:MFS family permease